MEGNNPYSVNSYYPPSQLDKKTNNVGLRYDWNRNARNSGYFQTYRNYYSYFNQGSMDETDWGIEGQQNFVLSDTNTLVGGLEYRDAKAHSQGNYSGKKGYNTKAVFLQDQWQFAPTWQLNTGIRFTDHSRSGNRTTGSAAINKKFSKDSHAYFSWNQVFRTPTIDDLYYRNYEYGYIGKDDLKPETGNVYTLGYNFKVDKKTDASVTAFYSNLHNALNWRYDYPYHYAENINREKKRGLSLTVTHKLNKLWDVDASYTYVRVTGKSEGYIRDDNYAPNYYQAGVRYHDTKWNLNLRVRAANGLSKKGRSKNLYSDAGFGENRYLTMDFIARYKFDQNWTGFANFYNLNNAAYAEQGGVVNGQDNHPMPGRRIIVGAEYSF